MRKNRMYSWSRKRNKRSYRLGFAKQVWTWQDYISPTIRTQTIKDESILWRKWCARFREWLHEWCRASVHPLQLSVLRPMRTRGESLRFLGVLSLPCVKNSHLPTRCSIQQRRSHQRNLDCRKKIVLLSPVEIPHESHSWEGIWALQGQDTQEWHGMRDDDKRPPLRGAVHAEIQRKTHLQECVR